MFLFLPFDFSSFILVDTKSVSDLERKAMELTTVEIDSAEHDDHREEDPLDGTHREGD